MILIMILQKVRDLTVIVQLENMRMMKRKRNIKVLKCDQMIVIRSRCCSAR